MVLQSAKEGGVYPAVLNGANEQAVKMFLENKISYGDIYKSIYGALQSFDGSSHMEMEHLIEADEFARAYVSDLFKK